jgi:hypothetical protein
MVDKSKSQLFIMLVAAPSKNFMSKQKKTSVTERPNNIVPKVTDKQAKAYFISKVIKTDDENNAHVVNTFLQIIAAIKATKHSFTKGDLYVYAGPFEIPKDQLLTLWDTWLNEMQTIGVIDVIAGCYDENIVLFR